MTAGVEVAGQKRAPARCGVPGGTDVRPSTRIREPGLAVALGGPHRHRIETGLFDIRLDDRVETLGRRAQITRIAAIAGGLDHGLRCKTIEQTRAQFDGLVRGRKVGLDFQGLQHRAREILVGRQRRSPPAVLWLDGTEARRRDVNGL